MTNARTLSTECKEAYEKAGFALFAMLGGKGSPPKKWQTTAPGNSVNGAKSFGVNLAAEDFVLDVDPRRYEEGRNQLVELWEKLQLPKPVDTFIVSTPSGGCHIYFKRKVTKETVRVFNTVPGYPAIEVKSKGRYILGGGSAVDAGKYTFKRNSPSQILWAPDSLLSICTKPETSTREGVDGFSRDDDDTKRRFIQYLMRSPAAVAGERNNAVYMAALEGRDYGLSHQATEALILEYYNLRFAPPLSDTEVGATVTSVYTYAKNKPGALSPHADFAEIESELLDHVEADSLDGILWDTYTTGANKGDPKPTLNNAVNYLRMRPCKQRPNRMYSTLRYNEFSGEIEIKDKVKLPWKPVDPAKWSDEDTIQLKYWLGRSTHVEFSTTTLEEAIYLRASIEAYHPVKEYAESIKWDGKPRIDTWLSDYCGVTKTPYSMAVGRCTLIAAMARLYNPGCQHDHMLVLEGEQGSGKSSVVRILGGKWYADIQIDPHDKDTPINMADAWICEASEMQFMRNRDADALKSFLTKIADKLRKPYGRRTVSMPRKTIFIGTINPNSRGYLVDETGNRRFWPVTTYGIKLKELKRDRDQLWAEAKVRFEAGEPHYLVEDELIEAARLEQAARMTTEEWQEVIVDWLERHKEDVPEILTTSTIATYALGMSTQNLGQIEARRIFKVMKTLGYENVRARDRETTKQVRIWRKIDDNLRGM